MSETEDKEAGFVLFDESNVRLLAIVDEEVWKRIQTIAWNRDFLREEKGLLDCRHDHVILYYSKTDRPEGQHFEIRDESEKGQHSILKAVMVDNGKIQLSIIIKNFGAYDDAKHGKSDALFSEFNVDAISALQGTKSDWDWAENKFKRLLNMAEKGQGSEGCPIQNDFEEKKRLYRIGQGLLGGDNNADNSGELVR